MPHANKGDVAAIDEELSDLRSRLARVQADYDEELIEARDLKCARNRYQPRVEELVALPALADVRSVHNVVEFRFNN
ncbi:hypothetical protein [uncultured Corynebacterium sp.]|uniref:hypothetical protein n=1 Tax=uncultured Corynebacterium sp. TaxID=159447 RepID=UPI0025FD6E36|nr:hypothetical protein [uncultured Corynebacterium sp.]